VLDNLNDHFYDISKEKNVRIGVLFLGGQSPGGNNILDGLLRF